MFLASARVIFKLSLFSFPLDESSFKPADLKEPISPECLSSSISTIGWENREFDIKTKAGSEIEVECDALKHTLHDYELELSGDDKRFTNAVKISEQQAKDVALSKYNGKVVDVEYAMENNNPTYEFDIYVKDKGHEFEVEVDGVTGKILETEIELYDIGAE